MALQEEKINATAVTALTGRLDGSTSAAYETSLLGLLQDGRKAMILDMAGVDYLSSAGIRVLLLLVKRATALNLSLAIARPQELVAEILSIAGLEGILDTYPSVEAAIQAVGG